MIELALFASSFVTVFALGFQQQNVVGAHYRAAFLTSFLIGTGNLFILKLVPGETSVTEIAAYLAGGPLGIIASMWVHRRTVGRRTPHNSIRWVAGREPTEAERRALTRRYLDRGRSVDSLNPRAGGDRP